MPKSRQIIKQYILEGKEYREATSRAEFYAFFEDVGRRTVSKTVVATGVEVSTVFLGFDHGFSDDGPPVLFESMVFGGPLDDEMQRYTTYAEAWAGHQELVARSRKEGGAPDDPWESRISDIFYDE